MKGKHKIEVRSGRVVFTIELERNITILRGDSATGKTTLVEMLQAYETYGRQSGVTVSCDKPCRVLSGVNWELQLNATHDSIVFVDEGSTFVSSLDFARAIQHSDNYYVLVTREDLSTLPYSVNAILELKKTTSRFKRTYNKAYPIYDSLTASNVQLEGVEKLLTEDANSGYQLFTNIGEKYGIVCISAAGKDIRCVTKDTADFCTGPTDVSVPILAAQPGKFIDDRLFPVALRIERENHSYGCNLFLVDNVCTVDLNHPPGHEW